MIEFKTKIGPIQVPNSFTEITIEQYLAVTKENVSTVEALSILIGLPLEKIVLIDFSEIMEMLSFLKNEELYNDIEPSNVLTVGGKDLFIKDNVVMRGTWVQKIHATNCLKENKPLEMLCTYIYPKFFKINVRHGKKKRKKLSEKKIEFMKKELHSLTVFDVFGAVNFVRLKIQEAIENDSRNLNVKPTPEQIEAGIDKFNVLEDFNSVDLLAGGNPLLYEKIQAMPYDEIFPKLLKNVISTKFERNLRNVMNKNSNA